MGSKKGTGMRVRQVVTGHDRDGKAVFASDQEVDPVTPTLIPSLEVHRLRGADQAPTFPAMAARRRSLATSLPWAATASCSPRSIRRLSRLLTTSTSRRGWRTWRRNCRA